MDFEWNAEERAMRQAVADALDAAGREHLEELETAGLGRVEELLRLHLGALAGKGYLGLAQEAAGRGDATRLMAGQLELARASGSLYLAVESSARLCGTLAADLPAGAARDAILEPLRTGEAVGAVALADPSEPDEERRWATTARREGSEWVLDGRKPIVTNGPFADWIAVSARTGEGALVVGFVDRHARGLSTGERARTMGYDGLALSPVELHGVRVPDGRTLGPGEEAAILGRLRQIEGLLLALGSVGLMERCLEAAKAHSRGHRRGGRPIFKWQEVSFRLAEMLTLKQTAELMAYRAGWLHATGDAEASTVLRCARIFAAESAEAVASMALQVLAGRGYLSGNVVERSYREAKHAQIAGAPSEVGRMAIGDAVLARCR